MFTNFTDNWDTHSKGGARGNHTEQNTHYPKMRNLAGYCINSNQ